MKSDRDLTLGPIDGKFFTFFVAPLASPGTKLQERPSQSGSPRSVALLTGIQLSAFIKDEAGWQANLYPRKCIREPV